MVQTECTYGEAPITAVMGFSAFNPINLQDFSAEVPMMPKLFENDSHQK
jgi:hypothetical protein